MATVLPRQPDFFSSFLESMQQGQQMFFQNERLKQEKEALGLEKKRDDQEQARQQAALQLEAQRHTKAIEIFNAVNQLGGGAPPQGGFSGGPAAPPAAVLEQPGLGDIAAAGQALGNAPLARDVVERRFAGAARVKADKRIAGIIARSDERVRPLLEATLPLAAEGFDASVVTQIGEAVSEDLEPGERERFRQGLERDKVRISEINARASATQANAAVRNVNLAQIDREDLNVRANFLRENAFVPEEVAVLPDEEVIEYMQDVMRPSDKSLQEHAYETYVDLISKTSLNFGTGEVTRVMTEDEALQITTDAIKLFRDPGFTTNDLQDIIVGQDDDTFAISNTLAQAKDLARDERNSLKQIEFYRDAVRTLLEAEFSTASIAKWLRIKSQGILTPKQVSALLKSEIGAVGK